MNKKKFIIYINSHCAAPDYEDATYAKNKWQAARKFKENKALVEFSVKDLLLHIEEESPISLK